MAETVPQGPQGGPPRAGAVPRAEGQGRQGRKARRAIVVAAAVLLLALLVLAVLDSRLGRTDVVGTMEQPAAVKYPDKSTHYVGVVRTRSWVLGRQRKYELYAGRDPRLSYGHYIRLGFTGTDRPVLREARWERPGVRARFTSGHEVFVPAESFMYGR